jgi:hypothetical protein
MIVLIVVIAYTLRRDIDDARSGHETARTVVSGE